MHVSNLKRAATHPENAQCRNLEVTGLNCHTLRTKGMTLNCNQSSSEVSLLWMDCMTSRGPSKIDNFDCSQSAHVSEEMFVCQK